MTNSPNLDSANMFGEQWREEVVHLSYRYVRNTAWLNAVFDSGVHATGKHKYLKYIGENVDSIVYS